MKGHLIVILNSMVVKLHKDTYYNLHYVRFYLKKLCFQCILYLIFSLLKKEGFYIYVSYTNYSIFLTKLNLYPKSLEGDVESLYRAT